MRGPLFQLIASGVVLGMMGGAVAIHALHVAGARKLSEGAGWESSDGAAASERRSFVTPTSLLAARGPARPQPAVAGSPERATTTTIVALEEIVARLQELKTENSDLEGQLKETNRDLMELQFRLDTHSEAFRPLRAAPPQSSGQHLLLPPKGQ